MIKCEGTRGVVPGGGARGQFLEHLLQCSDAVLVSHQL